MDWRDIFSVACHRNLTLGLYLQNQLNSQEMFGRLRLSTVFDWRIIGVNITKCKCIGNATYEWIYYNVCGVDGAVKSYVDKLIPILDLIPFKTNEYMEYDVVRLY